MIKDEFNKKIINPKAQDNVQLVQNYNVGVDRGGRFSVFADSAAATTLNIFLKMDTTSECEFKITFGGSSSEFSSIKLFEAPTTTANGTLLTPQNRRRDVQGVNTCPHSFYKDATVTDNGTQIAATRFLGGSGRQSDTSGSSISADEFIPDNSKNYLLIVTGVSQSLSLKLNISGSTFFNE